MKMFPQFPHMVLNSHDVPPPDYKMWNSWKVAANISAAHMFSQISSIADNAPGKRLGCVIFNSHGTPGKIWIGKGISMTDMAHFDKIKGKVMEIWIIACNVALIGSVSGGFCQAIADRTGAVVTASTREQSVEESALGYGEVDFYEGQTFIFRPGEQPFQAQSSYEPWRNLYSAENKP